MSSKIKGSVCNIFTKSSNDHDMISEIKGPVCNIFTMMSSEIKEPVCNIFTKSSHDHDMSSEIKGPVWAKLHDQRRGQMRVNIGDAFKGGDS